MPATLRQTVDPAHDVLRYKYQSLDAIFNPKTIAVIGATEHPQSVGRTLLWNLISHPFGGSIFPIHPTDNSLLGLTAYPHLQAVPEPMDLAIIATPAPTVPDWIQNCVDQNVKGAIILSDGFKEIGLDGVELEQKILQIARTGKMRILGPNCLGLMNPITGLNATFASGMAKPGNVGFISQSGALCTSILDWSFQENVGFSAFVSVGSMLDLGWGDLIYYLGNDPRTHSIVIYMESIGDARSFLSAAREVALTKPIIVIKAGRTDAATQAAVSHTGDLVGSDEVVNAAFRRCGVLRVYHLADLFSMAELLAKQPRPKGSRLTILTNAGGLGVLSTDSLIGEGGTLAQLSSETIAALNHVLPPQWSHSNPIDILGDADPERYRQVFEIIVKDPNSDGILVILTPQAMTNPTQTAEQLKYFALQAKHKPILASWMGGPEVAAGVKILNQANIATFSYPDSAVRMFNYMWRHTYTLRGLYETPSLPSPTDAHAPSCDCLEYIIQAAVQEKRTLLTEFESKRLLSAYHIPTVDTQMATTVEDAVATAERLGYPVVLKLLSKTITHKSDVGGVELNLKTASDVTEAYRRIETSVQQKAGSGHFLGVTVQPMIELNGYELILGSHVDAQFGPVLLFGMGGQLVEVFHDKALALPPLNTTLARRMMEQTKIYKALLGVRGRPPVDMEALEQLLVTFSNLVVEQPWIQEIEINPLLVSEDQLIALDARVVLHSPDTKPQELPKPAIRSYPYQYVTHWISKQNIPLIIRPIRPEDEPLMVKFDESLSEESVYLRYAHLVKLSSRITHERLSRLCFIDYDREMALVAECQNPSTGEAKIMGIGRLSKSYGTDEVEFSLLIRDEFQHQGLGTELLRQLLSVARQEKMPLVFAEILTDNRSMQRICEQLGFTLQRVIGEPMVRAEIQLDR